VTTVFSSTATVVGDAIPFVTRRLSPRGLMWLRFEFEVSLQRGKLLAGLASWDRCKRAAEHVELPVPVVANGCLLGKERSNYKVGLLSTFRFWSQDLRLAIPSTPSKHRNIRNCLTPLLPGTGLGLPFAPSLHHDAQAPETIHDDFILP